MTTQAWIGLPLVQVACILLAYLIGHRAGVLRERERSNKRAVQLMETRRAIERAAR